MPPAPQPAPNPFAKAQWNGANDVLARIVQPDTTLGEQMGAAFQRENFVVNIARSATETAVHGRVASSVDKDFDIFEHITDDELLAYPEHFLDVFSMEGLDRARKQIEREHEWARRIEDGPLNPMVASIFAAVADPTILVPFVGAAVKGGQALSYAARARAFAVGAMAEGVVYEATLHQTQRTRTLEESAWTIVGAAVLGAGLGAASAGAARASRRQVERFSEDMSALARAAEEGVIPPPVGGGSTTGAAAAGFTTRALVGEETELVSGLGTVTVGKWLARALSFNQGSTSLELLSSPVAAIRSTADQLFDHGMVLKGHVQGLTSGGSVDNAIKSLRRGGLVEVRRGSRAGYKMHQDAAKAAGATPMGRQEFLEEVGKAMRRNDQHADPGVAAAAQHYRKNIVEPLAKRAIELGLLPEGVTPEGAASYFMRVYAANKILGNRTMVTQAIADNLLANQRHFMAEKAGKVKGAEDPFRAEVDDVRRRYNDGTIEAQGTLQGELLPDGSRGPDSLARQGDLLEGPGDRISTPDLKARIEIAEAEYNRLKEKSKAAGKTTEADAEEMSRLARERNRLRRQLNDRRRMRDEALEEIELRRGQEKMTGKGIAKVQDMAEEELERLMDPDEALEAAAGIVDQLTGWAHERTAGEIRIPALRGPMKNRTWHTTDEFLESLGILNNDAGEVMTRFVNTMAADIAFAERFAGKVNPMEDIRKQVLAEVSTAAAKTVDKPGIGGTNIGAKTAEAQRLALDTKTQAQLDVIEKSMARMRGLDPTVYTIGSGRFGEMAGRVARQVRTLNYTTMMGGVTLSNLPDMGALVIQGGVMNTFGTLLSELVTGFSATRAAKSDLAAMRVAMDLEMAPRVKELMGAGEHNLNHTSWAERRIEGAAELFGKATLLPFYDNGLRRFSAVVVGNRLAKTLERVAKGETLNQRDRAFWAQYGIAEADMKYLAAEAGNFQRAGSVRLLNTEAWENPVARRIAGDTIREMTDTMVLLPGAGDKSLWADSGYGRIMTQFMGYGFAANQKIFIRSGQRLAMGDMSILAGISSMTAMGVVTELAHNQLRPPEQRIDYSQDMASLVNAGLARGGLLTLFYEADNLADMVTGYSMQRAMLGSTASKFDGRRTDQSGVTASLLKLAGGASASSALRVGQTIQDGLQGRFTDGPRASDNAFRLAPGNNLIYLRWAFNQVNDDPDRRTWGSMISGQ